MYYRLVSPLFYIFGGLKLKVHEKEKSKTLGSIKI